MNTSVAGLAPLCWAAAPCYCRAEGTQRVRPNLGQKGGAAVPGLVHTAGGSPALAPVPRGTTRHHLLGPDSLLPDDLVIVVVGNEKGKMFIFPKQRGT